jgi:general stress protein 26
MPATETQAEAPTREEAIRKISDLIHGIRIAMLTTTGTDGSLHSRPMATQNSRFNGELWFLTGLHSGKVHEIRNDSEVALTYVDEKHTFVSLSGRATVSTDRAKIEELWSPTYQAWFPEGKEDPEISVLRVDVDRAEYWDAPANAIVRNVQILARAISGGKTPVGEHATVSL